MFYWSGGYDGPINPGDRFAADLDFSVSVTGGDVAWDFYADMWSWNGYEDATIFTSPAPLPPPGQVSGVHLVSSAFSNAGDGALYQSFLHIDWTNFSPTDTLTLAVPQHSIDVTYVAAPEPAATAGVFLAAARLLAGERHRGTKSAPSM